MQTLENVVTLQPQNGGHPLFDYFSGVWCNGNTTDSGPVILGSSPSTPTQKPLHPFGEGVFVLVSVPFHSVFIKLSFRKAVKDIVPSTTIARFVKKKHHKFLCEKNAKGDVKICKTGRADC